MACPEGYAPAESVLEFAAGTQRFTLTEDPVQAVQDADAVYAGLWFSGETEKNEKNLKKVFSNYQVNDILIRNAKPDAIVLHCLPAHRGQEITAELFETHAKEIFDQSENRLHAQKAVLVRLLGGR